MFQGSWNNTFINGGKAREYAGHKNMRIGNLANSLRHSYGVLSNGIWHYSFQNFRQNTYKKTKLSLFDKEGKLGFELTVN